LSQYFKMTRVSDDASKAALLTGEAGEVLILFRDITWSGRIAPLTLGTRYYLSWNGSTYATSTIATNFQDNYALSFTMSSVRRDGSSDIVTSGGSIDASTLKATVIVSPLTSTSTIISSSELLIHNVYSN